MKSIRVLFVMLSVAFFAHHSNAIDLYYYCIDNGLKTGNHPHPTNCNKFIECSNGITNVMDCPPPLAFNEVINRCDDPIKVPTCHGGVFVTKAPSTTPSTLTPTTPTTTTPTTTTPTTTTPTTTTPSTITTTITSTTTIPSTTRITGGDVTDYCKKYNMANGIHVHPYECHMYIECTFLVTAIMNCPGNLVFDPTDLTCEDASMAAPCSNEIISTQAPYLVLTDIKNLCRNLPLADGIHPHPFICDKFIMCSGKQTIVEPCSLNTKYNSVIRTCDDVHNVDCSENLTYYYKYV